MCVNLHNGTPRTRRVLHLHFMIRKLLPICALATGAFAQTLAPFRPPAVPLVAHDPYFSIWSMADRLNADGTKHWTGKNNTITAYARIDGKSYRIMGRDRQAGNELAQTKLEVLPTRTIYAFAGNGVSV